MDLIKDLLKLKQPIVEAPHHMDGNRLHFAADEDVHQLLLTRTDPHDLAQVVKKIALMNAYADIHKRNNGAVSMQELIEEADSGGTDFASSLRNYMLAMTTSDFAEEAKRLFPGLPEKPTPEPEEE